MINKAKLYYNTLNYVKLSQLYYQLYYRFKTRVYKPVYAETPVDVVQLKFSEGIKYPDSRIENKSFSFLNLEKYFNEIDWNFSKYGKLWTYNLNYFEFLNQENITREEGLNLILDYISKKENLKDGLEPYPISLRGINWIKFLSKNKIRDHKINKELFNHYQRLADNLEYHLLANHLLENVISLLFGAYYFKDNRFYNKAKVILEKQLNEQILNDGAHFELSPMYHQIILHRILDSYNLVENDHWKNKELLPFLKEKAEKMLGWLQEICFENGSFPKLNDSADGIAPTTVELQAYASDLGLNRINSRLFDSGYRKFKDSDFEIIMDVGQIAPAYQPGHSHADSLQFVLNYKEEPIIVDTGISTYEKSERRHIERSTSSHNTITVDDKNSSSVWGGFRVAERATVKVLKDTSNEIEAQHDGYSAAGILHNRKFSMQNNSLSIEDRVLMNSDKKYQAKGHLHFHPDTEIDLKGGFVLINDDLELNIIGAKQIELVAYDYAEGFNKLIKATKIEYTFKKVSILEFKSV